MNRFDLSKCSPSVRALNPHLFANVSMNYKKPEEARENKKPSKLEAIRARYPQFPGIRSEAEARVYQQVVMPLGVTWFEAYESASYVLIEHEVIYTPDFDFFHGGVHHVIEVKGKIRGLPGLASEGECLIKFKLLRSIHPDWDFRWLEVIRGRIIEKHQKKEQKHDSNSWRRTWNLCGQGHSVGNQ